MCTQGGASRSTQLCEDRIVTVPALTARLPALLANRFRALAPVGRGAIAEVVRARDEQTGDEVALKILYPHLRESAVVVERFRREVDIVRRVAHPHVLAIRDVVDADGQLFLVMDYHPGGDLADRLAVRRRFDAAEVRLLAAQLCGALAAAHRAGVVHRDVKPSNVLCGPGAELDVRLCDFGLARATELSGLTTANAVLGTPEYMAPEVVTDGHADPRSDVYSLGVVLFEAATGRLPFYGDSPYQLMRQHVDIEAPRARTLAPELPAAIDAAIARALAKDPLDRFSTADDLARALAEDVPAEATALVAPASPPAAAPARRVCQRCGGWVVDAAGVCADCGKTLLRLEYREEGGVDVLVTGPGEPADKLDAWRQVALYKILDELPQGSVAVPRRGRRRAPRVPFYVARGISTASARALIKRLESVGLTAGIGSRWALAPRALRSKLWRTTYRPLAGMGILGSQSIQVFPRGWGLAGFLAPFALAFLALGGFMVAAVVRCVRPVARRPSGAPARSDAEQRLDGLLARIVGRQDRRLLAHIIERLAQSRSMGHEDASQALAGRAAQAAEALAALDGRRKADASVTADPAGALEELRREEMTRVVLRADLLRAASWLDRLCQGAARAGAADQLEAAKRLEDEIRDLGLAVDAEAEVGALLGGAK